MRWAIVDHAHFPSFGPAARRATEDSSTVTAVQGRGGVPGEPPVPGTYRAAVSVISASTTWTPGAGEYGTLTILGLTPRPNGKDGNMWRVVGTLDAILYDGSGVSRGPVTLPADF